MSESVGESVGDVAKKEATKETIQLAFTVAGVALFAIVERHMSDPDFWRTIKMRSMLMLRDFADSQQKMWQKVSDYSSTSYRDMAEW
jgi:hypothetical protein